MDPLSTLSCVREVISIIYDKAEQMKRNKEDALEIAKYLKGIKQDLTVIETNLRVSGKTTQRIHDRLQDFHILLQNTKKLLESINEQGSTARNLKTSYSASRSSSDFSESMIASAYANKNSEDIIKMRNKIYDAGSLLIFAITAVTCDDQVSQRPYNFYPNEERTLVFENAYCKNFLIKYLYSDTVYCLKVITEETCRNFSLEISDIVREVNTLKTFMHEGVCQCINILDQGGDSERPELRILMEHVEGRKLSEMIGREPFLFSQKSNNQRFERLRLWMKQVASALDHVHAAGITHRNLCPENLVMDLDSQVLILTNICVFSSALVKKSKSKRDESKEDDEATALMVDLSCAYVSPERLENKYSYDSKDDMWALGCIFAELIRGHRFDFVLADKRPQFRNDICSGVLSISSNVGRVVGQLLEANASKRLSAGDVLKQPEVVPQDDRDFVFRIGSAPECYSMVQLNLGELPPKEFDCIYVLSVPLKGWESGYKMSPSKVTHSVVLLLNKDVWAGYMLEYNASNTVQLSACRLVKRQIVNTRVYEPFSKFEGFYSCQFDYKKLTRLNSIFEEFSKYHYHKHNCHVYHRTLVATAVLNRPEVLYSLRKSDFAASNIMTSGRSWVQLVKGSKRIDLLANGNVEEESISLRKDVLTNENLVDPQLINVINYDELRHTIVSDYNMTLSLESMIEQYAADEKLEKSLKVTKKQLADAVSSQNLTEIQSVLVMFLHLGVTGPEVEDAQLQEREMVRIKGELEEAIACSDTSRSLTLIRGIFESSDNARYLLRGGDHVILQGLQRADLNGCEGDVLDYLAAKDRFRIKVTTSGNTHNVKPINLKLIPKYVDQEKTFHPVVKEAKNVLIDHEVSCIIS